jgi:hypothetical protein
LADAAADTAAGLIHRRVKRGFIVLLALLVASVGWLAYVADRAYAANSREADVKAVQRIAGHEVVNLYSLSYKQFDSQWQTVLAGLTGSFKKTVVAGSSQVRNEVVNGKVVSSATPAGTGLTTISGGSATVIVVVDRVAQSSTVKTPTEQAVRVQVLLSKSGGTWLVSSIGAVS